MGKSKTQGIWLPSRIKALRILTNLSQADLGDLVGVDGPRISNFESGRVPAPKTMAAALHLVRRLKNISIAEIYKEIEASPHLMNTD